ncbi:hypothetical protein KIF24_13330 [Micromonospora sp. Llam7]|uniref:PQQ-dependent sugar dehydrogenase n=1 Tax=Micromonospora tarapacensis TaxID=2835305 RepID=UPI001C83542C|nr:PQQ-dependent sugar dehydrogenase [Micromonospora tarapacensis]MBX7266912.1 hypothetical protein [Micromonospora tarapacensis]
MAAPANPTARPGTTSPPPETAFQKVTLNDRPGEPMDLAVLPDGRVLHVTRAGEVWLHDPDTGRNTIAATLDVYLYYSPPMDTPVDDPSTPDVNEGDAPAWGTEEELAPFEGVIRLSRFRLVRDRLVLSTEQRILDVPVDRGICCHVGGDIVFDAKGNLDLPGVRPERRALRAGVRRRLLQREPGGAGRPDRPHRLGRQPQPGAPGLGRADRRPRAADRRVLQRRHQRPGRRPAPIVVGNAVPVVELVAPVEGQPFAFGDTVQFEVQVTDDQAVDCARVGVTYVLGHDDHGHPQTTANGCTGSILTTVPSGHDPETDNLSAVFVASCTDAGGDGLPALTGTDQVVLVPGV